MSADTRLVLRFEQGQFSFRPIGAAATDGELYNLAMALNEFQVDPVVKVIAVSTRLFN